jgi:hypothetical protein
MAHDAVVIARKTTKGKQPPSRGAFRLRRRARRVVWWSVALIAFGAAGGSFYYHMSNLPGTYMPSLGNAHLQSAYESHVAYNSDPPTSGPHMPSIAPWGIHTEPVSRELQVHNLEDGGVLVQYHCLAGCPELVQQLKTVVGRYDARVILAPQPGMRARIALTAWTRIDTLDEFDEKRITRFIDAYRGIDHHARS